MKIRRTNIILTVAAVAMACFAMTTSANAAVIPIGTPDFSLASSTSAGTVHDNLPAAFLAQLAPGDITSTASSNLGAAYPESALTDGDLTTGGNKAWASASASTVTLTLDFASADVAGIILNWGWGNRTPGDYEVKVNGTSLGSIQVDDGGGTSAGESTEKNTYIIFDSVQSGATKIEVLGTNGNNQWGLDEIEVYTGVPEPATMSLMALGGIALIRRRRRA
jgi:hypothetical protein